MFRIRPDLTSNYSLLLASAFISFAIWLIAKQADLMEDHVTAEIRLSEEMDADIRIVPEEATVFLQLPVWQQNLIAKSAGLDCWIEIQPSALGDPFEWCGVEEFKSRDLTLQVSMVARDHLPSGIQVVSIRPGTIQISGKLRARKALIKVQTTGQPAEGYQLPKAPRPKTESLFLTGPQEALDRLPLDADGQYYVEAEDIDLSGRKGYFEAKSPLRLPEGIVPAPGYDSVVSIIVGIEEVNAERTVGDVPIRVQTFSRNVVAEANPETASVIVEGPRSMILGLEPADFSITLKDSPAEIAGTETSLALACQWHESVAASVRENVRIVGVEPKSVVIKMLSANSAFSGAE